jgi:hypothetical protein
VATLKGGQCHSREFANVCKICARPNDTNLRTQLKNEMLTYHNDQLIFFLNKHSSFVNVYEAFIKNSFAIFPSFFSFKFVYSKLKLYKL